ncbi:hypothetical protein P167DRAFT_292790 [Morchella conica CCBAS932]|uniref:Uncharacterized protein n=1 Tax=Morchella conica CCBAS932 TaxID=1392247 RepID=A0A3N4KGR8_9PEZI|nr:hypothetical protein P167DRAFT_292790 [Morchella conica CCBAS932]
MLHIYVAEINRSVQNPLSTASPHTSYTHIPPLQLPIYTVAAEGLIKATRTKFVSLMWSPNINHNIKYTGLFELLSQMRTFSVWERKKRRVQHIRVPGTCSDLQLMFYLWRTKCGDGCVCRRYRARLICRGRYGAISISSHGNCIQGLCLYQLSTPTYTTTNGYRHKLPIPRAHHICCTCLCVTDYSPGCPGE